MKRKIDVRLDNWAKERATALLITGARQVGKTYSARRCMEKNFATHLEVNFSRDPVALDLFSRLSGKDDFYAKLSLVKGKSGLESGSGCVFLDEIQEVYTRREEMKEDEPSLLRQTIDPITLLKGLVEDGRYRYIVSGSLLGVSLFGVALNPVGYMDSIEMFPMDFQEYLMAKGLGDEVTDYLRGCFEKRKTVDDSIHRRMLSLFREYVLVGGMPEAVESFISFSDFPKVGEIQKQIIAGYRKDVSKYAPKEQRLLLIEAFDGLPSELNARSKRYKKTHLSIDNIKNKDISEEFLWLKEAGVALPCYHVSDPFYPLRQSEERKVMKLFASDVGLLSAALLSPEGRIAILNGESPINYGAPYENAVAEELWAHGNKFLYYWNDKKEGEVDFLTESGSSLIPLEVKSGKPKRDGSYNHLALDHLLSINKEIKTAYVLSSSNVRRESDVIWDMPIYFAQFLDIEAL